jgi:hypothetical protein
VVRAEAEAGDDRVLTRAGITVGQIDRADGWAQRADRHAAVPGLPAGAVRGACARAEVQLARDEPGAAAELALSAAGDADRVGAPRDAADARLLAGRALAAANKRSAVLDILQRVAADAGRGCAFSIRDAAAAELR